MSFVELFGVKNAVVSNQKCPRCSRTTHKVEQCHAKRDMDGETLEENLQFDYSIRERELAERVKKIELKKQVLRQKAFKTNEQERLKRKAETPCLLWIAGKCFYGSSCHQSHSDPNGFDFRKKSLCYFHRSGNCNKGDTCYFSHALLDFPCAFYHVRNNCRSGDECPYSHLPLTEEQSAWLEKDQEEFRAKKDLKRDRDNYEEGEGQEKVGDEKLQKYTS